MCHVRPAARRADAVHEAHLSRLALAHNHGNLPPLEALTVHDHLHGQLGRRHVHARRFEVPIVSALLFLALTHIFT